MSHESQVVSSRSDIYRINTREQYEINYWAREFGVSADQLLSAVSAVGDAEDKVRQHLETRNP